MMKAKVRFVEKNRRLEMNKTRTLTFEVKEEDFRTYNVDAMERTALDYMKSYIYKDSTIILKTIKVGRTEFQL